MGIDDEDQGDRPAGAEVLGLDRRVDLVVLVDVPADVDLEAGVRRERADDRAPEVLLIWNILVLFLGLPRPGLKFARRRWPTSQARAEALVLRPGEWAADVGLRAWFRDAVGI